MPTGRFVAAGCPARAALAGNPSDLCGGAVVAVPIDELIAVATATEAPEFSVVARDAALVRVLRATAAGFAESTGRLPPVQLSASTTIPRSVGLGRSSAVVIAALRALGSWTGPGRETVELAELALAVERERLGVTAGLAARLVQAAGRPVAMSSEPPTGAPLVVGGRFHLFAAWSPADSPTGSPPGDVVHRSLRRRWEAGDADVRAAMARLATLADRACAAITAGDHTELAATIDGSLAVREAIAPVTPATTRLVEIARGHGVAVNPAGHGGSVCGLATSESVRAELGERYRADGAGYAEIDLVPT